MVYSLEIAILVFFFIWLIYFWGCSDLWFHIKSSNSRFFCQYRLFVNSLAFSSLWYVSISLSYSITLLFVDFDYDGFWVLYFLLFWVLWCFNLLEKWNFVGILFDPKLEWNGFKWIQELGVVDSLIYRHSIYVYYWCFVVSWFYLGFDIEIHWHWRWIVYLCSLALCN